MSKANKIFPVLEIYEKNSKIKKDYHAEFAFNDDGVVIGIKIILK